MFKKLKRPIHKFPPILFPIWVIVFTIDCVIKLVFWLLGYWMCDICHKRQSMYDRRYKEVIPTQKVIKGKLYTKYRKMHICDICKEQMNIEKEQKQKGYY